MEVEAFGCSECSSILFNKLCISIPNEVRSFLQNYFLVTELRNTSLRTKVKLNNQDHTVYREILCNECQHIVGRAYISTPSELDFLRGVKLIKRENVKTVGTEKLDAYPRAKTEQESEQKQKESKAQEVRELKLQSLKSRQEIEKLVDFFDSIHTRISQLERYILDVQSLGILLDRSLKTHKTKKTKRKAKKHPISKRAR